MLRDIQATDLVLLADAQPDDGVDDLQDDERGDDAQHPGGDDGRGQQLRTGWKGRASDRRETRVRVAGTKPTPHSLGCLGRPWESRRSDWAWQIMIRL